MFTAAYLRNCSSDRPLDVTLRDGEGTFTVKVYTAVQDRSLVLASNDETVATTLDDLEMPVRTRLLQAAVRKGTPISSPLRTASDLYVQEAREVGLLPADFR